MPITKSLSTFHVIELTSINGRPVVELIDKGFRYQLIIDDIAVAHQLIAVLEEGIRAANPKKSSEQKIELPKFYRGGAS